MKALTSLLSMTAAAAILSAAPAAAQVAGNPGDLHAPTQYTKRYAYPPQTGPGYPGYGYNWATSGQPFSSGGVFAPIGVVATGVGALGAGVSAVAGAPFAIAPAPYAANQPGCRAFQDFNGRRTSVCGP